MRSPRTVARLGAGLVLALLLAGCSGSDGSDDSEGREASEASAPSTPVASTTSAPSADPDGEPAIPLMSGDACASSVTVTGDIEQAWDVEGAVTVSTSGPAATYQTSDGATVLTVYAAGGAYRRTFILAVGLDSYASATDERGLRVAADGSAATVDADATSKDGRAVHVTATFACRGPLSLSRA